MIAPISQKWHATCGVSPTVTADALTVISRSDLIRCRSDSSGRRVEEGAAVNVEVAERWWAVGKWRRRRDGSPVDQGLAVCVERRPDCGVAEVHPHDGSVVARRCGVLVVVDRLPVERPGR